MRTAKPIGPLATASLDEIFLWVRDLRKMRAFYREVLGLTVEYGNPRFCLLRAGKAAIALHAERERHRAGDNWYMEFQVRDIDAVVAELRRRGVEVPPVADEPFGRVTSLRDPEGNEIGLEEPPRKRR